MESVWPARLGEGVLCAEMLMMATALQTVVCTLRREQMGISSLHLSMTEVCIVTTVTPQRHAKLFFFFKDLFWAFMPLFGQDSEELWTESEAEKTWREDRENDSRPDLNLCPRGQ